MKVKKVMVDQIPKDCTACPLTGMYRKNCGRPYVKNYNGGLIKGTKPGDRCKLMIRKKWFGM